VWDRVDPTRTRHILRPTGPNGEQQEWTAFAPVSEALVWRFAKLHDGPDAGVLLKEESHPPDILGNRRYPEPP
jgi:hypothetical protein